MKNLLNRLKGLKPNQILIISLTVLFITIITFVPFLTGRNILDTSVSAKEKIDSLRYVPNQYLIKFKEGFKIPDSKNELSGIFSLAESDEVEVIDNKLNLVLVKSTNKQLDGIAKDTINSQSRGNFNINNRQNFQLDASIEYIFPDFYFETNQVTYNDQYFNYQWGAKNEGNYGGIVDADIDLDEAHAVSQKNATPIIAVIDTGVDVNHPDLKNNILRDDQGNLIGYDFVNDDSDPNDENGHGTHVAGIIAAEKNEIGIVGVCPECKIMPLKAGNNDGLPLSAILSSFRFAIDNGAQVINNSWGCSFYPLCYFPDLELLIDEAYSKGVSVVFAAGNDGIWGHLPYPAFLPKVIAVSASSSNDEMPIYTNRGRYVDIIAPGGGDYNFFYDENGNLLLSKDGVGQIDVPSEEVCEYISNDWIFSTISADSLIYNSIPCKYGSSESGEVYSPLKGTSMATPQVAGALGLMLMNNPNLSLAELNSKLMQSADKIDDYIFINDNEYANERYVTTKAGRLNVNSLITNNLSNKSLQSIKDSYFINQNGKKFFNSGDTLKLNLEFENNFGTTQDRFLKFNIQQADSGCIDYGTNLIALPLIENWQPSISYQFENNFNVSSSCPDFAQSSILFEIVDSNGNIYHQYLYEIFINTVENEWPVDLDNEGNGFSDITLGDVNNNGKSEIVYTTEKGIYVRDGNGNILNGWPQNYINVSEDSNVYEDFVVKRTFSNKPLIVNIDNDPENEILIAEFKYRHFRSQLSESYSLNVLAFNFDGTLVEGFSYSAPKGYIIGDLAADDLDGDGIQDIVFSTTSFSLVDRIQNFNINVLSFNKTENKFETYTKPVDFSIYRSSYSYYTGLYFGIGDINGDNLRDIYTTFGDYSYTPTVVEDEFKELTLFANFVDKNIQLQTASSFEYNQGKDVNFLYLVDIDNDKKSEILTKEDLYYVYDPENIKEFYSLNLRDDTNIFNTQKLANWPANLLYGLEGFGVSAGRYNNDDSYFISIIGSVYSESNTYEENLPYVKMFNNDGNFIKKGILDDQQFLTFNQLSFDINGDNIQDILAMSDPFIGQYLIPYDYYNDRFLSNSRIALSDSTENLFGYSAIDVGDTNGDGKNNIIVYGPYNGKIALYNIKTQGLTDLNKYGHTGIYGNEKNNFHIGNYDSEFEVDIHLKEVKTNRLQDNNLEIEAIFTNLLNSVSPYAKVNFEFSEVNTFINLPNNCKSLSQNEIECIAGAIKNGEDTSLKLILDSSKFRDQSVNLSVTENGRGFENNTSNNSLNYVINQPYNISINLNENTSSENNAFTVDVSVKNESEISVENLVINFQQDGVLRLVSLPQDCINNNEGLINCNFSLTPQQTKVISFNYQRQITQSKFFASIINLEDDNLEDNSAEKTLEVRFNNDLAIIGSNVSPIDDTRFEVKIDVQNVGENDIEKGRILFKFNNPVQFLRSTNDMSCSARTDQVTVICSFSSLAKDSTTQGSIRVRQIDKRVLLNNQSEVRIGGGINDENLLNNFVGPVLSSPF